MIDPKRHDYQVILADPPWQYDFSKSASRQIENQYPTMTAAELISMRPFIDTLHFAAPGAILFMWATAPKLAQAIDLVAHWGFDYKTFDVWIKVPRDRHADQLALAPDLEPTALDGTGMGYYTRVRHEPILIATTGEIAPPPPAQRPVSAFYAERRGHSQKPDLSYQRIERMYPTARRIELFARERRVGWDRWGNEAPL
jgi:N6-adenosine-specific RNA methylase IME4